MFFFERIRPEIQKALFKRINSMNREKRDKINSLNPISEAQVNPLDLMLTKSCWVRVHSTLPDFKKDENGKLIRPLEPAKDSNDKPFRISGHFKDGQPLNRALTSKVNLLNNPPGDHLRAPAGVTGVTCNFMDKSVQKVTVNFKLYDTQDFEIYEHAFLKHGRTVLVEFGWSVPDTEFTTMKTRKDMLSYFYAIEDRILEGNGDYHAAIGTIGSFSFDLGQNGEYNCSFDLISLGNTLFKGQVQSGNGDLVELVKVTNDSTYSEAFRQSGYTFNKTLEKLNEILKEEMKNDNKRVYYNDDTEKGYCTWGWFEDVLLNKFFSTIAEVQNKDGTQTLTTKILSGEIVGQDFIPNKCRNSHNLFTQSKDIIFPDKIIGIDGGLKDAADGKGIKNQDDTEDFKNLYNTLKNINEKFQFCPSILRGPRNSIAILDGKETEEELKLLSNDIFEYFGFGCRSISKIYVPINYDFSRLKKILKEKTESTRLIEYVNSFRKNKAINEIIKNKFHIAGKLILTEDKNIHAEISSVNYEYYSNLNFVHNEIRSNYKNIQCFVGNSNQNGFIKFGETQKPNLWNYADNIDTVEFLLSL